VHTFTSVWDAVCGNTFTGVWGALCDKTISKQITSGTKVEFANNSSLRDEQADDQRGCDSA
jgi:hypothetical protein